MYGLSPKGLYNYDHHVFPGAVPRTFVGSVVLAWITTPLVHLGLALGLITSKFDVQIALRLTLASLNALGLVLVRRAVSTRFGRQTGKWYALLTCSQFHLPFWMGRTLPNMFALVPVTLACYLLHDGMPKSRRASRERIRAAMALLTFTAVVFRAEVVLLLAPLALQLLIQGHTTLLDLVQVGLVAGLSSLVLTVLVDSYFWRQWPLWPELYGLYFNVYLGKSADWGTSPAHVYFTAYLPKLLLGATPMAILGAVLDHRIRSLLVAPLAFVFLLSALGHKEWRFIIYVVPQMNIAAARGARWMTSRKKGMFRYAVYLCTLGLLSLNVAATILLTRASMENYPGGTALAAFHRRYAGQEHVHVHISNLAAQTGASLFLHEHASPTLSASVLPEDLSWTYNKTESLMPTMIASSSLTHLISESPEMAMAAKGGAKSEWTTVETISGFERWQFSAGVLNKLKRGKVWEISFGEWVRVLEMERRDRLWILERRPGRNMA